MLAGSGGLRIRGAVRTEGASEAEFGLAFRPSLRESQMKVVGLLVSFTMGFALAAALFLLRPVREAHASRQQVAQWAAADCEVYAVKGAMYPLCGKPEGKWVRVIPQHPGPVLPRAESSTSEASH
jgi:hypothetical protein